MVGKTPKMGDFDADEIAVSADQHAKDVSALSQRIKVLEEKFGTPIDIAKTLHEAAEEAVKMQDMLESSFKKLLCKNEPIRNEIKQLIKEEDRAFIQTQLKQYKTWIGAAFLFLVAQGSIELIKWLFRLFPPSAGQ